MAAEMLIRRILFVKSRTIVRINDGSAINLILASDACDAFVDDSRIEFAANCTTIARSRLGNKAAMNPILNRRGPRKIHPNHQPNIDHPTAVVTNEPSWTPRNFAAKAKAIKPGDSCSLTLSSRKLNPSEYKPVTPSAMPNWRTNRRISVASPWALSDIKFSDVERIQRIVVSIESTVLLSSLLKN